MLIYAVLQIKFKNGSLSKILLFIIRKFKLQTLNRNKLNVDHVQLGKSNVKELVTFESNQTWNGRLNSNELECLKNRTGEKNEPINSNKTLDLLINKNTILDS